MNINSNEPTFYSYSSFVKKCSGSCNNINDPYPKLCVFHVVKIINVKVLNLISRTNETRHKKWKHKNCNCKCRLDANVCNTKQGWNNVNADGNAKNWLINQYVIKDLFGIHVIVNVNVIHHVMLFWRVFRLCKL